MKVWPDKLREMSIEKLEQLIDWQKREIAIKQRDLGVMERILKEKVGDKEIS